MRSSNLRHWLADMIGINQQDRRTQQASCVGGTYGQAAKAIALIGKANSCISDANEVNVTASRLSMHDSIGEVVLERHGYPRIPEKRWSALVSLVDRT